MQLILRCKTPARLNLISDAVAPAGLGDGDYHLWGETIRVANGRTGNEKGSIAGSVITMLDAVRMMLSLNVIGMLLAFVAVVALLNALVAWPQSALGVASPVSLQQFFGWLNAPFAWLLGIPAKDCGYIGQILGERIVLNEFIGYIDLSNYIAANPGKLDERSVTLASYALCGFANFSSIAIQIGGISALCPERRGDLARIGMRAMISGLLACYLFTAVVGIIL